MRNPLRAQALPRKTRRQRQHRPWLENLEDRTLLSGYAQPTYLLLNPTDGIRPLGTGGPTGYTPAQVRHAYGFDQINFPGGIVGDGAGTTIAIVDAFDNPKFVNSTSANFNSSDLHQFDVQFGLPDPFFLKVNQTGGAAYPPANSGWASEIALDVEWAHAIAPKANILLVEANDNSLANLMAAVRYAANQPGVVAVSLSWGASEFSSENLVDSSLQTPGGHGGVTFVASSGDSGAPPIYPSVSPNVLSVGGTTLNLDSMGTFLSEGGWGNTLGSSGGGISAYEVQPAYQKGVVTQSTTNRATPDVAYDADPFTGFPVYDSYNNGSTTPWSQFGGTSASAPQWAALIAIADQGRAIVGKAPLDGVSDTLPMLYKLPASDFRDVTTGGSLGTPHYNAGPGYDLVTGLGSPIANRVVAELAGTSGGAFITSQSPTGTIQPGLQSVQVTFNAPVQIATFDISDITGFVGPSSPGSFIVAADSPNGRTATTFTISFVLPLTASGSYSFRIGPNILDANGHPMDQNLNGLAGEATDFYTVAFAISNPAIISSSPAGTLAPSVVKAHVTFNEPINASSFDKSKITAFTRTVGGTTTNILGDLLNVTPTGAADFDIIFASGKEAQTGTYSLTIGPKINDTYGNPMASAYTMTFSIDGPKVLGLSLTGSVIAPINSETVTFSRAIDPNSFTTSQVTITGPGGATVAVSSIVQVDATHFTINFAAPQSASGTYTTVLRPSITDMFGNALDQNGDLNPGQSNDSYTGTWNIFPSLGPDAFGYIASVTNPQNLDIVGQPDTFTLIATGDDVSVPLSLNGSTFSFYGKTYTSLYVGSNGIISFNFPDSRFYNVDLTTDAGEPIIAPLWDDWFKRSSPMVVGQFRDFVNNQPTHLVLEWYQIQHFPGSQAITFEVQLDLNTGSTTGNILFNYQNIDTGDFTANGQHAVVGIKDAGSQTVANNVLQVSNHQTSQYVGNNKAILFSAPTLGATISGTVYNDVNHNGSRDGTEGGLGGWTIYVDSNNNGLLDPSEPSTLTDGSGNYTLSGVTPGTIRLREVVQSGNARSQPAAPGSYVVNVGPGQTLTGQNFGNYQVNSPSIVDNNDSGFATTGSGWTTVPGGYLGAYASHGPGGTGQGLAGPDGFGYQAVAVPFQNLELAGDPNAFVILNTGDDAAAAVDLGSHVFSFYGQQYTGNNQLYVSSNGLISFGTANTNPFPGDLSANPFQPAIVPLWNDWVTGPGTPMILGKFDNANHRLIIEWNKIRHYPGLQGGGITFQAILSLDGTGNASDIVFNYVNLTGVPGYDEGNGSGVGIKANGFQGSLRLVINSAGVNVATGHAIRITTSPIPSGGGTASWTVTPASKGVYELFTTWVAAGTNATNATYKIYDGSAATGTLLGSVVVDQTQAPSTALINGSLWDKLGTFTTNTGTFTIVLDSVTANANISADAVFAAAAPAGSSGSGPLLRGTGTGIASGASEDGGPEVVVLTSQPGTVDATSGTSSSPVRGDTLGGDRSVLDQTFTEGGLQLTPTSNLASGARQSLPSSGLLGDPLTGQLLEELAADVLGMA
jgi:hypothetical protein